MAARDRAVGRRGGGKGERTRQRVIEQAAPVFNQRGYWGSSLRDVMDATGLEKGGIYNHFRSKDELAAAAFEHNVGVLRAAVVEAVTSRRGAVERLSAVFDVYRRFVAKPPFPGGCPLLNAAVEVDDTHPGLRDQVRQALDDLRTGTVARVVAKGVERGELRPGTDPDEVATVVVSALEGALMLTQLYRDTRYVQRVADHLDRYVASLATGDHEQEEEQP